MSVILIDMCGICGFTLTEGNNSNTQALIKKMSDALSHRGPDDQGIYIGSEIALGHRRLSIIDLGTGNQPIFNEDRSLAIVFNGEIYNFLELKEWLEKRGHIFSTHSDTEVIVHLYEEKKEGCLELLNGMFAFAIWDTREKKLFIARDRFGQKPLYYTVINNIIIFASEIKSLRQNPLVSLQIDKQSLCQYLACEYVPSPFSIFEGIHKLNAGHFLIFKNGRSTIKQYWDYFEHGNTLASYSENEIAENLSFLFGQAVKRQMISDVPLGIFLSGGIDSSAIVAFMSRFRDTSAIKTFSIGFEERSFDESNYARQVAAQFKTEHYEKTFDAKQLLAISDDVFENMDEPLADASLLPTYLLSGFAGQFVKVALSGDGGDELFCGYPTFQALKLSNFCRKLPAPFLHYLVKKLAEKLPLSQDNFSLDFKLKQFLKGMLKNNLADMQLTWIGSFDQKEIRDLTGQFTDFSNFNSNFKKILDNPRIDIFNKSSYIYIKSYLQDDILTKTDRASMANSLEVRSPFFDLDFIKYTASLNGHLKIKKLTTKYIFKKALTGILPKAIINRPKKGFGIPIAKWLCADLKDQITDSYFIDTLHGLGINKNIVKTLIDEHISFKKDNRKQLWTLFVLVKWKENLN